MCWKCDHPDRPEREYLDEMHATMMRCGWAIQYVESDRVPFAYTLGLTRHDLPELLVTGVSPQRALRLLNGVARKSVDRGAPRARHAVHRAVGTLYRNSRGGAPGCALELRHGLLRQRDEGAAAGVCCRAWSLAVGCGLQQRSRHTAGAWYPSDPGSLRLIGWNAGALRPEFCRKSSWDKRIDESMGSAGLTPDVRRVPTWPATRMCLCPSTH